MVFSFPVLLCVQSETPYLMILNHLNVTSVQSSWYLHRLTCTTNYLHFLLCCVSLSFPPASSLMLLRVCQTHEAVRPSSESLANELDLTQTANTEPSRLQSAPIHWFAEPSVASAHLQLWPHIQTYTQTYDCRRSSSVQLYTLISSQKNLKPYWSYDLHVLYFP